MCQRKPLTSQFPFHTIPANNILACSTSVNLAMWLHIFILVEGYDKGKLAEGVGMRWKKWVRGGGKRGGKGKKCNGPNGHDSNTDPLISSIQSYTTKQPQHLQILIT